MFNTAHLSDQQILTLYGIVTYLSVFPVLLLAAALAGYLRNRSLVRAGIPCPHRAATGASPAVTEGTPINGPEAVACHGRAETGGRRIGTLVPTGAA